jgi:hypothetical protein
VECGEVDAEPEGLRHSAARVRDLELGGPVGMSSFATSLSSAIELIEDRVFTVFANGVH